MESGKREESEGIVIPKCHIAYDDNLPPLVAALKASAEENVMSFHFPGHNRGHAAPSSLVQLIGSRPFFHDLPSLPQLDNLSSPKGPILEAQKEASKLFGASETWFLVGGTTCGIQAAIMATCSPGEYLILPRNSHLSAISAMVLSGVVPKYIMFGISLLVLLLYRWKNQLRIWRGKVKNQLQFSLHLQCITASAATWLRFPDCVIHMAFR